jgi:hypothetical protein
LRSLQRANLHQVTLIINNAEHKVSIAANPQFKSVYAFDFDMKKVNLQSLFREHQTNKRQRVYKKKVRKFLKMKAVKPLKQQTKNQKEQGSQYLDSILLTFANSKRKQALQECNLSAIGFVAGIEG